METRNFSAIIRFVDGRHAHATPPRRPEPPLSTLYSIRVLFVLLSQIRSNEREMSCWYALYEAELVRWEKKKKKKMEKIRNKEPCVIKRIKLYGWRNVSTAATGVKKLNYYWAQLIQACFILCHICLTSAYILRYS